MEPALTIAEFEAIAKHAYEQVTKHGPYFVSWENWTR
jgi:hypothetical protein